MLARNMSLFLVAAATLMLELLLTRVFDVILTPNMAYMVISCALLAFGLAGIGITLYPSISAESLEPKLPWICSMFALGTLALLPVFNTLPFDYERIPGDPVRQLFFFAGMYLALLLPFFFSGLVFASVFSVYSGRIQSLYFWDLSGAAVGCVLVVPLLPPIGPGGILLLAAAFALVASALLSPARGFSFAAVAVALVLVAIPLAKSPEYLEFHEHLPKRGVKEARREGRVELTHWDPVSKIDVIDQVRISSAGVSRGQRKHVAYDGGTQSSHIYPFDSDYPALRSAIESKRELVWDHFWHRGVLASHYLKRDSGQRVLVVGSAGGQETKAALMYGAAKVDAVELVRAVVELGKGRYARYNGGIFLDPRVSVYAAEGRSFLRATPSKYDIIQIHSNHTSSSIAAGTGAMSPNYLQTTDAYREYFSHLTDDGILHVNHHIFPRMVTTAALAWSEMGRNDFQRHVLLFSMTGIEDPLPTFLVKASPWRLEEIEEMKRFIADVGEDELPFELMQNPFDPEGSFLPPEFFSGHLPASIEDRMHYQIRPPTDDRPFFNFLRRDLGVVEPGGSDYADSATAQVLNSQLRKGRVPMDLIHLIVTAVVSLGFAAAFVLLPLRRSEVGRAPWASRGAALVYFSCLGAGFIILELSLIQILMKLIGYPVHTYALVIFTLLFGAGLGSLCSEKLGISPQRRWFWPFLGILSCGVLFTYLYPGLFNYFLSAGDGERFAVGALSLLPLGFFLGMPFPLGILALERKPGGAIAWAWGMNGLFTVVGSLASVVFAIAAGFRVTLLLALAVYAIAFLAFSRLRRGDLVAHS